MGQKSGRNGAPAPQSRVSLSESKPEADFCLLECVRSFLLGVFLRIRSRPFSLAVRSRAVLCARLREPRPSHRDFAMSGDRNFRARWSRPPCGRIEEENCADVSLDRKSTRLNSSHTVISYAVFCLKKKKKEIE